MEVEKLFVGLVCLQVWPGRKCKTNNSNLSIYFLQGFGFINTQGLSIFSMKVSLLFDGALIWQD